MIYDLQKANIWKRISAFLFDSIMISIVAVGIAALLALVLGFDGHFNAYSDRMNEIGEEYGVDFKISASDFDALSAEEKENYEMAQKKLYSDTTFLFEYSVVMNLTFIIIIFSLLFAFIILEFVVPMLFKNGQTLGKKVFGIAVMRVDGVKVSGPVLFTRTILGKYTIETMLPIMFILLILFGSSFSLAALIALAAILITNVVMLIVTKNNYAIHDMISNTVTVDLASQMIFDSSEALLEYKKKIHAEEVEKKEYF